MLTPAAGTHPEAAVAVLEADPKRVASAESEYLLEHHPFPPRWTGREVEVVRQALVQKDGRSYDRVTLACAAAGEEQDVWFDVSRAGPAAGRDAGPAAAAPTRRRRSRAARIIVHVFALSVAVGAALLLVL